MIPALILGLETFNEPGLSFEVELENCQFLIRREASLYPHPTGNIRHKLEDYFIAIGDAGG